VPAICQTEYGAPGQDGRWDGLIRTPDTPEFWNLPDFVGPFLTGGPGTAVFTPNGNFNVVCHGTSDLFHAPIFNGQGDCLAARGGDPFGHGAKVYMGTGKIVVNPSGNVTITCHGSFVEIFP
jgi:hypothetical protein